MKIFKILLFILYIAFTVSPTWAVTSLTPIQLDEVTRNASQGDAYAQYRLGEMYYEGEGGLGKNYRLAKEWFEKAASQGIAEAQYKLGTVYDRGAGVHQDYKKAARWYQKAAIGGYSIAQRHLAYMYDHGAGVTQDHEKARDWYKKSAAQGDRVSQKILEKIPTSKVRVRTNKRNHQNNTEADDGTEGRNILLFLIAVVGITSIWLLVIRSRREELKNSIKMASDIIDSHSRALGMQYRVKITYDPYGTMQDGAWIKEATYFYTNYLEHVRPDHREDEFRKFCFAEINRVAAQAANEQKHSLDLGMYREDNDRTYQMTGIEYEHFCCSVLKDYGWEARVTKGSGDQGADIIGTLHGLTVAFQCKLYRKPVGNTAIQEAKAAAVHYGADMAAVISHSGYTSGARQLAKTNNVYLLTSSDLPTWIPGKEL